MIEKSKSNQLSLATAPILGQAPRACPRIENLLRKSWIWPDSPIIFVKYAQYSPQMIEKSESNQLSLATAPILGQAPRDQE
ncbi:MAG: hypothetical protein GY792_19240 [Gammaproteobacteria bacterium]|nr:hypothetical protein [Gammaproteobacteria bacterium]